MRKYLKSDQVLCLYVFYVKIYKILILLFFFFLVYIYL